MPPDAARADGPARRRRVVRELAGRLADTADETAVNLDKMAEFHEAVSADSKHPLFEGAAEHAVAERRYAAFEREQSVKLRRTAAGFPPAGMRTAGSPLAQEPLAPE